MIILCFLTLSLTDNSMETVKQNEKVGTAARHCHLTVVD